MSQSTEAPTQPMPLHQARAEGFFAAAAEKLPRRGEPLPEVTGTPTDYQHLLLILDTVLARVADDDLAHIAEWSIASHGGPAPAYEPTITGQLNPLLHDAAARRDQVAAWSAACGGVLTERAQRGGIRVETSFRVAGLLVVVWDIVPAEVTA